MCIQSALMNLSPSGVTQMSTVSYCPQVVLDSAMYVFHSLPNM